MSLLAMVDDRAPAMAPRGTRATTMSRAFHRGMAAVYAMAFASFYSQIPGLVGDRGITPYGAFFKLVHDRLGGRAYYLLPSLAWLHPTTGFLQFIALAGALLAIVAAFIENDGVASRVTFGALWVLWLSIVNAGGEFMSFQWDVLLLEAGFLAVFYSPLLVRCLVFKLMFLSGAVKLLSHDPTWRNWTALDVHYQTQPIPNAIAWYFHNAPHWFGRLSLGFMWTVELAVPFLVFAPRRARHIGGGLLIAFQLILIASGNYAFFNWLTIVLCLSLFDEDRGRWKKPAGLVVAAIVIPVSLVEMASSFDLNLPDRGLVQLVSPYHIVNSYGLFAVMTTTRPEIVIEGTADGITWRPYEFKYKPGDLHRRPPFVAPHQPRLDWQMWFAALGGSYNNRWFGQLMLRLLQGRPEVVGLLAYNPFPEHPPKAVRATLYEYRFTTSAERAQTGDWWVREPKGPYFPEVTLPQAAPPAPEP